MAKHVNGTQDCPACHEKLLLAHPDLSEWYLKKVKPAFPLCHVSWSYRDQKSQEQAFLDGKSKLHFPNSPHNKTPAMALDLFELSLNGMASWAYGFFRDIAALVNADHDPIFWGGNFAHLMDFDHFELREPGTESA